MAATKIDGTAIARKVRERLHAEIAEKKGINPRFQPCLKIIQGALHPAASRESMFVTH
jgi:methylenetetrahydrofolate dehydrogenase (NADP+)/methenyltetrahydrofolate cyclohydrolase/formyltetrahydrofolate synthetase